jgi:hypothetical protein
MVLIRGLMAVLLVGGPGYEERGKGRVSLFKKMTSASSFRVSVVPVVPVIPV